MNKSFFLLPSLAIGGAALLLAPARESYGFSKIGGSLSASSQRDFRIRNNFADSAANNNTTPDANWPGWQGADMAIWKGAAEWASRPHGVTGAGDPLQTSVGDGDANFDFFFGGAATANGNSGCRTRSAGFQEFTSTHVSHFVPPLVLLE